MIETASPNKTQNDPEPILVDRFGRQVTYVRLSVTDRCDLRCVYCMYKNQYRGNETL